MSNRRMMFALGLTTLAGLASASNAQVVSGTYNDLSGSYNGATFNAHAVDQVGLRTQGNVDRTVSPTGSAQFAPGFVSAANPADFVINLSYIPAGPGLGLGSGAFTVTDVNGVTISGLVDGFWIDGGAQVFFNGTLSAVSFSGPTFTGDVGSFSTAFGAPFLDGALSQLYLVGPGNFFTQPFADVPVNLTFQLTPAPGAAAVLGLGALVATRRRR